MNINQWNEDRLNEHLKKMDEPERIDNQWDRFDYSKEINHVGEILQEYTKATIKFPTFPTDIIHAVAIVNEESGEAIRAALQYKYENGTLEAIEKELIQTAAMCLRCLYNLPKF